MVRKAVLFAVFVVSAGLFYAASPSWGCGIESVCVITCYDSSGQQIGAPVTCKDMVTGTGSCACDTEYNTSGQAACHSHCTALSGEDTYCTF